MKLTVIGLPVPQGSKSARVFNGRAILTDGFGDRPRRLKEWRQAIAAAASAWMAENGLESPQDGPLALTATFFMPRPKTAAKRLFPAVAPDADKLARSCLDALTGVVYTDDSRVVDLFVQKRYASNSPPRVEIDIRPATEEDL